MADIFIVHPSVFQDAFRTDYTTVYRDSSRDFLNILRNHSVHSPAPCKIGFIAGEVFKKLADSPIGHTSAIWIIAEHIVDVDFETYHSGVKDLDKATVRLASKKCIKDTPIIVTTKKDINLEGTTFLIRTPLQAIEYFNNPNSHFSQKC